MPGSHIHNRWQGTGGMPADTSLSMTTSAICSNCAMATNLVVICRFITFTSSIHPAVPVSGPPPLRRPGHPTPRQQSPRRAGHSRSEDTFANLLRPSRLISYRPGRTLATIRSRRARSLTVRHVIHCVRRAATSICRRVRIPPQLRARRTRSCAIDRRSWRFGVCAPLLRYR